MNTDMEIMTAQNAPIGQKLVRVDCHKTAGKLQRIELIFENSVVQTTAYSEYQTLTMYVPATPKMVDKWRVSGVIKLINDTPLKIDTYFDDEGGSTDMVDDLYDKFVPHGHDLDKAKKLGLTVKHVKIREDEILGVEAPSDDIPF